MPLLEIKDLQLDLGRGPNALRALDGVSLTIREGHTVGVVGESGSGKTTLGLALLRLQASTGAIEFAGHDTNHVLQIERIVKQLKSAKQKKR